MENKYLVLLYMKVTDEKNDEEHYEEVDKFFLSKEAELVSYLTTYGHSFMDQEAHPFPLIEHAALGYEENEDETYLPEIVVLEDIGDNKLRSYSSFSKNDSLELTDLFEEIKEVSEEDDPFGDLDLFTLLKETMEIKNYRLVILEDRVHKNRLIRDIVGVYNILGGEEGVLKIIKGPIGQDIMSKQAREVNYFAARLTNSGFSAITNTEAYLCVWSGAAPGLVTEYSGLRGYDEATNLDELFEYKQEKPISRSLLAFNDYLKEFAETHQEEDNLDPFQEWGAEE